MQIIIGCFIGFCAWFVVRYLIAGLYTVDQNERAVKTRFGRADRIENLTILDDPQGPPPRRGNDQADRKQNGEPAPAGGFGDQTGWGQSGDYWDKLSGQAVRTSCPHPFLE